MVDGDPAVDFVPRLATMGRNRHKNGVPAGSKREPLPDNNLEVDLKRPSQFIKLKVIINKVVWMDFDE